MLDKISKEWQLIELSHKVSKTATNMFWKVATDQLQSLQKFRETNKICRKIPQFRQVRKRLYRKHVPRISLEIGYLERSTGKIIKVEDTTQTPASKYPPNQYKKLYEQATVNVQDILKIHNSRCPNPISKIQLSSDGVHECKSNSVSLDVYSCKAINCKQIYPLRIIRPLNKHKIDNKLNLEHVICDLLENKCTIENFVGDNPKRANAKECLNHASSFPCEYCFAKATTFTPKSLKTSRSDKLQMEVMTEKINNLKKERASVKNKRDIKKLEDILKIMKKKTTTRSHLVMPSSTMHAQIRTNANIREIVEKIEENSDLDKNERKGVIRRSPLMSIPNFDIVKNVTVDYMHCICIGVVKRMLELTFDIGENRNRNTSRKLSSASTFNELMINTKVAGEFSRRIRELDFAVMKASEFRNIILFFFPHVIQCIQEKEKERSLWLYLAYMVRCCILPTPEFNVNYMPDILFCSEKFYALYEALFGESNCTYNTHVGGSHLLDMRYHGPLTATSAFPFESFYGELRNSFTAGTQSTLKQMFEKILLKRAISPHSCKPSLLFSTHDTALECNSLIYVYRHGTYHLYTIVQIINDQLICNEINKIPGKFDDAPSRLKWENVGVFEFQNVQKECVVIKPTDVCGKLLKVGKHLITCPNDVLTET